MGVDATKLSEVLPHEDRLPHTRLSRGIRRAARRLAGATSWIWFEEIQWHLYAIGFLVAIATCMDSDDHIRVDVFHERLAPDTRAWVELYGLLLLFLPFVVAMIIFSVPFVAYSLEIAEVSDAWCCPSELCNKIGKKPARKQSWTN